jgi:hypothetical protein
MPLGTGVLAPGTTDVLLTSTSANQEAPDELLSKDPPIEVAVSLSPDLRLEWLDPGIDEKILDACEPRAFRHEATRQWGGSYSFIRENPPVEKDEPYKWDPDQVIRTAVALSRLIQPTEVGTEYAVRVNVLADGEIEEICPGPIGGHSQKAYLSPAQQRRWLTQRDGLALRELRDKYLAAKATLPERIGRALWNHEYGACIYWLNVRWTVMTTALEALVHTDRYQSTKQFVTRAAALAAEVGVAFTEADADEAYELRSAWAHGAALSIKHPAGDDHPFELGSRMEAVLRGSVRRAIEDVSFRAIFVDDATIRAKWPI